MTSSKLNYSSPYCFFGFNYPMAKGNTEILKNSCEKLTWNLNKFSNNISPLVEGKNVSLDKAIKEVKKIIKDSDEIHMDGFSCDQISMIELIKFAQEKLCTCNHLEWARISNFFINLQRFGGAFSSLNETINRCDFLFFVGWNNEFQLLEKLIKEVKNRNVKVFILTESKKFFKKANIIKVKSGGLGTELNLIINTLKYSKSSDKKYDLISKCFNNCNYPVFVPKIKNDNYDLITLFFKELKNLNKKKPTKILNTLFTNNAPGFINACVIKSGYPNSVSFSSSGPLYDPLEYNSSKLKDYKDLQIFVSCFENDVTIDFFKKNIFIGHPHFIHKKKVNVFIPTKIPGVDSSGLILRPELSGVIKLRNLVKSNYPTLGDVLKMTEIKI